MFNRYYTLKHIKAKTPDKLQKMMILISIDALGPIEFANPTHVDGEWYTWYKHDYSKEITDKQKMKDNGMRFDDD